MSLSRLRFGLLLTLVLAVGAWLRWHEVGRRPMHADEANQAVKLGALLERGDYAFDPRDHHGPTLYYFARVVAWVRGEHRLAELTESTVRLTPVIFGVAGLGLLAWAARPLGRGTALLAAAFMAVSPASVYYSRYFIQETLLVTFAWLTLVCAVRWRWTRQPSWAWCTGASVGLMQATKASAPFYVAAALLAWVLSGRVGRQGEGEALRMANPAVVGKTWWRQPAACWLGALGAFLAVAGLFYSSFFTHAQGLLDAVRTYAPMSGRVSMGATGHEKPFWYFANLFWWQRQGGYVWDQTLFLSLAVGGTAWALASRSRRARAVAWYTLLIMLMLSALPYKTPWLVVNLIPPMAVLAAWWLTAAMAQGVWVSVAAWLVTGTALLLLGWQTRQAVFLRPADPRNPLAYVHSSPDVTKVPMLAARAGDGPVKVISEEYWPLPWYLRQRANVGYWSSPPADVDGALVLVSADLAETVSAQFRARYRQSFLGLRPGFVLVVYERLGDPSLP